VETTKVAAAEPEKPKKKGGVLGYLGKLFKSKDKETKEDTSAEQPAKQEEPSAGAPQATSDSNTPATDKQAAATPGLSDYEKGLAYSEGNGVPQNDGSAFILFQSAAQENFAPAQYQLGNAYMGGYGTEKNPDTAIAWYEKSARQGYALAQRTLASIYMNGGNGVKQNKPLALAWYSILSGEGNVLDIHRRDLLKGELSGPEVQESEKLKQELSAGLPTASASY
jgi:TPR repeat protein